MNYEPDLVRVPAAPEIERSLLGAALAGYAEALEVDLQPETFYTVRNRLVWSTIQTMRQDGRELDYQTLVEALDRDGKLAEIGGPAYLMELLNTVPFGARPVEYAAILRERQIRRRALEAATKLAQAAYDLNTDFEPARAQAIDSLVQDSTGERKVEHISQVFGRMYDQAVERSKNPMEVYGIPTGMKDIDSQTAGLQKGEMFLLAGDPGVGKTVLFSQIAAQAALAGRPGVVYELEMGSVQLVRRMAAVVAGLDPKNVRSGRMSDEDWRKMGEFGERSERMPLWISEDSTWTTTALRADLQRRQKQDGIEWFLVDYLSLMADKFGSTAWEREGYASKQLRRICKDAGLAGMVIHKENKTGMLSDGKSLGHLAGASDIGYDADVVAYLTKHLPAPGEQPKANMRTLTYAKFREDLPNRFCHLVFKPALPAFADYAPDQPNAQRVR